MTISTAFLDSPQPDGAGTLNAHIASGGGGGGSLGPIAAGTILGNAGVSSAVPSAITAGSGLVLSSGNLSVVGVATTSLPTGTLTGSCIMVFESGGVAYQTTLTALQTFLGVVPGGSLTVNTITPPAPSTTFTVSGTYASYTPTAFDYSTNGGSTWTAVSSPTISGGTYSFSLTGGLVAGTYTVKVRDRTTTTIIGTSASFTVTSSATIAVNTITPPAPSTTFTVSGTYANFTPTALDYSTNSGSTWTAAPSPTISGGTYSFSLTGGLAAGTYTVKVRDHTTTTIIGTSASFTISAGGSGTLNNAYNIVFHPSYPLGTTYHATNSLSGGWYGQPINGPALKLVNASTSVDLTTLTGIQLSFSTSTTVPPPAAASDAGLGAASPINGFTNINPLGSAPYFDGGLSQIVAAATGTAPTNYYLWIKLADGNYSIYGGATPIALQITFG